MKGKTLLCLLMLATLMLGALPAGAQDRPIEMDEIASITLEQSPAWGNTEEMTTETRAIYPSEQSIAYQSIRQKDGGILSQRYFRSTREAMEGLVKALNARGFMSLPEFLETDVLDGHFTYISVHFHDGSSFRTGGLVAEEYGPEDFRAMVHAIEEACESAEEETSLLAPLLVSEYLSWAWGYRQEAVFLDQYGTVRIAEGLRESMADDMGALLLHLSDPNNSQAIDATGEQELQSIGLAIDGLTEGAPEILPYAEDAGLLRRYAFQYDTAGNRRALLLSVEGDDRGRREEQAAIALCAFMSAYAPASSYFGEGFGYAYNAVE